MIPVNEPWLTREDAASVLECLRSGWVSSGGPFLEEFERRWAAFCGRRWGVAVSSGTAALELALRALDLKLGDEVILPAFTIISCALAVVRAGGVCVLADSEPRTGCVDAGQVRRKVTRRTRAILAVHMYGHPADMGALERLGVPLIEDAAQAHGAEVRVGSHWRRCGSFGLMSCFSFYANKLVTTGEGGMILTDDAGLASRLRSLRNLCFGRERRFVHEDLGFNYRLSSLQAALGLSQIRRMPAILERKSRAARAYARGLAGVRGLRLLGEEPWARPVRWVNGVVLEPSAGLDAAALARRLSALEVETRPFFEGMHKQPALRRLGLFRGERYPVSDLLSRNGLYLPSGLALTLPEIERVCAAVRKALS